jgi:hypothetical protein
MMMVGLFFHGSAGLRGEVGFEPAFQKKRLSPRVWFPDPSEFPEEEPGGKPQSTRWVRIFIMTLTHTLFLSFICLAGTAAASGQTQTPPEHQHPVLPKQPRPAGSTPASGKEVPTSESKPTPGDDHAGMAMPAPRQGGTAMSMDHGHGMNMSFGPVADTREASGTAWQPETTPMHAHHAMWGDWQVMTHYNVFLAYDDQSGPRGDDQLNSINWLMLMATRRGDDSELSLRGMFSLEPLTTTKKGLPLLFQSGEAYEGQPLIDRQHPHDFFMELAGRYRRLVGPDTLLSLYVAPSGEPALGPPAFMHRMSAQDNPAAPVSHHWLDSTHISFGVVTLGVAQKTWQLEGSWFNGREPDEARWNIERPELDSYSARLTWNPTDEWSAQVSHGYLDSPEELHPGEHLRRTTASVVHLTRLSDGSHLASTFGWGRNDHGNATNAFLIEPSYVTKKYTVFGRAEYVQKTGEELGLVPEDRTIGVKQFTLGATRELLVERPYQLALGASLTYTVKPDDLDAVYGKNPMGFWIFLRLRPAAIAH